MANQHDADVLIVGCGPVGAMAALRCAQRGLTVIIIDRSTQVYPLPRAIGMDDEVQDLFARAGLIDELREHSTPMRGAEFLDADGERVVGLDIPPGLLAALGHPPMVAFDQPGVERFLRAAIADEGVDVRLGVEATNVVEGPNGVALTLGDGTQLTSRWLIAADGAKSTVREVLGIEMVDQAFDQTWLVVDTTELDPSMNLPVITQQHCNPSRITTFVPGHRARRRWEFQLKPDETREEALEPTFLEHMLEPWATPDQLQVDRVAVYRFHATVARCFRDGSIFLVGDAAHQMPPFNGQGMCSGMRDAENLAWKLAAVRAGQCSESLLGTYDQERRPHATSQVAHSVDAGQLIEAIAHDGERALESGYGRRKFPKVAHGLVHGDHRLVGMPLPKPLDDSFTIGTGWTLLRGPDAAGEVPATLAAVGLTEHPLTATAYGESIPSDAFVLVRPDRFVAAVTKDLVTPAAKFAPMLNG